IGCACLSTGNAGATWAEPLTPPSWRFKAPGSSNSDACPSGGGWAELHDLTFLPEQPDPPTGTPTNYMPIFCPRSFNDYTANHSHGPMHATGFLHSDNGYYGIYDETGHVFASSDIAIRLDP